MEYRCEATSLEGFVQQLAVAYLPHGYWWYVSGKIPDGKDPKNIDERLIDKYDISVSPATRWRRKQLGKANMQYLRYEDRFILLATKGKHRFREEEANVMKFIWNVPYKICNYSISHRQGGRTRTGQKDPKRHSHVQIEWEHYKELKAMFLGLATQRSVGHFAKLFYELPFEAYAPVRRQVGSIWKLVNKRREQSRLSIIPKEALPLKRRIVKPFQASTSKQKQIDVARMS